VEIILAILIAKGAFLPPLLGTFDLSGGQWLIGAAPALALFIVWELGKAIARHRAHSAQEATLPAKAMPVESAGVV
jgi:hypothetical protein